MTVLFLRDEEDYKRPHKVVVATGRVFVGIARQGRESLSRKAPFVSALIAGQRAETR